MRKGSALKTVREAMTPRVVAVELGAKAKEALAVARQHSISHLPVVQAGSAVGVVCTCDLEDSSGDSDVSSLMHTPPLEIAPNHTLAEAAELMADRGVGSLLVQDSGTLVGIITRTDLERLGLAEAAFGERRCYKCGSYHHVRVDSAGYLVCGRCRSERVGSP
jgi:CBS domain-containing protein